MRVSEQDGVCSRLSGPINKCAQATLDSVGISMHQQQPLSLAFQEQFPRRIGPGIAIPGYMDDLAIQSKCKIFGVLATIAEMEQGIEGIGHLAGKQGEGYIPVAIRYNEYAHGVTVPDSTF